MDVHSALDQVRKADQQVWDGGPGGSVRRRDEAARAAVREGVSVEDMAVHLGVLPTDVRRWLDGPL